MEDSTNPQSLIGRLFGDQEAIKNDETGLGESEHWRFTPSMLDTNSYAFTSFVNQHSETFTPTLGGFVSGVVQNQAGELHTPGMAFGLGTPLSISTSESHSHTASVSDMQTFPPHLLQSQPFPSPNRLEHQRSYAPSSFVHQDSGYETRHGTHSGLSSRNLVNVQDTSTFASYSASLFESAPAQPMQSMEKCALMVLYPFLVLSADFRRFRYQVTLNAPTAMIKHADEIPVTYLNKGQAYAVSISDSMGLGPAQGPIKYRTVIRISFEDEHQRERPSACWQLWKEGRGLAEAHQRAGRLQAVEYVDANQGNGGEYEKRPRVELEKASFDSFSVTWNPSPGSGTAECSVAVRFNFLSTDFSHSKGVKGIPVRLCAKTEIISSGTPDSPPGPSSEVCFCKVKLFRDHGAERKLSNDVAHIKKTIDKLNQQITQIENGVKEVGKRKRTGGDKGGGHRPGKAQKHKRTWSVSSQGSNGRPAIEEDLHVKLGTMQDMFSSTRPVSVLYLRGYEQDDPDAYPVSLPGEPADLTNIGRLERTSSWNQKALSESTPTGSSGVSPCPSSRSVPSGSRPTEPSSLQNPVSSYLNQQMPPNEWEHLTHFSSESFSDYQNNAVRVSKGNIDKSLPDWIEAFEVDPSYKAPPERATKPVACFYVLIRISNSAHEGEYYKAVYLMERTVKDLITRITVKCGVQAKQVIRTLRVNSKGLKIMVDDEVVQELPEGQDMIVEFTEIEATASFKQEPKSGASTPKASELPPTKAHPQALEMRLLF